MLPFQFSLNGDEVVSNASQKDAFFYKFNKYHKPLKPIKLTKFHQVLYTYCIKETPKPRLTLIRLGMALTSPKLLPLRLHSA